MPVRKKYWGKARYFLRIWLAKTNLNILSFNQKRHKEKFMEKQKQKSLLKRLYSFAGGHKHLTNLGMILSGISAVMTLLPIIFIYRGVSEIISIYPNITLTDSIKANAWLAVGSAIGAMVVYLIALMLTHIAAYRIAKNMRKASLNHIMSLPLGFFSNTGSGKLRRIINDSAAATETYLAHQLPDMVGAYTTPIAVLAVLFVFDWRLGLISLAPVVLAAISMMSGMGKDQPERIKQYQSALENMNNEATEYVRGVPVVKTFNQSVFSFERFYNVINRYKKYVSQYSYRMRMPMTMFQVFLASTPIFLVLSSIFIIGGQSDMTTFFLSFFFYLIFTPIASLMMMKIMWVMQHSMLAKDALDRVENLLNEKPLPKPTAPKSPKNSDIYMENISFTYPNTDKKAIDNINISIKQGQTVAFVGPSGGGKTTLATLIPRFWDVDSGTVSIGGVDVRNIDNAELMKKISFVFQSTNLYKASILDNLREGNPEASIEEVNKALKVARCEDIIAKLPNGLDTIYGTKGVYLSGGEAQRIALARAILRDAPIILLDEATAFADPENEHQIQLAFNEMTKGKTVLMIAHRLSTIKNADLIYVIADGRVVQQGTHSELVAKDGLYSDMWVEYNNAFIWNEVSA